MILTIPLPHLARQLKMRPDGGTIRLTLGHSGRRQGMLPSLRVKAGLAENVLKLWA